MKRLVITLVVVFAALVVAGILILSGNNQYSPDQTQNQGTQTGEVNESPENNTQTGPPENNDQPQTYSVEIKSYAFNPLSLTINVGDTVIWTNMDSVGHTVTSDSGSELNSQYLYKNKNYSYTFTQSGTFPYHCKPHPYMKGTVIVE